MRLLGLALLLAAIASPALAESDGSVTVLRGASAPPPPAPPAVVQTTVVVPEIVYVPAYYYPGYVFYYPNFFLQPRRFANPPFATTGLMHPHR